MPEYSTLQLLAVAVPSFLGGMGRLVDLGGVMGPVLDYRNPWEQDSRAMWGDWQVTMGDVASAFERHKQGATTPG